MPKMNISRSKCEVLAQNQKLYVFQGDSEIEQFDQKKDFWSILKLEKRAVIYQQPILKISGDIIIFSDGSINKIFGLHKMHKIGQIEYTK